MPGTICSPTSANFLATVSPKCCLMSTMASSGKEMMPWLLRSALLLLLPVAVAEVDDDVAVDVDMDDEVAVAVAVDVVDVLFARHGQSSSSSSGGFE